MVEAFEINSQAKMIEFKGDVIQVDTTKVLVFVVHDSKIVYLWRGKKADLFEKLMGTRVAAKLSHTYNDYRIRPISEGKEPASFLHLIGKKLR
ncbi:MAG: hypothetical protein ACW99G_07315 [Candidatus Thorarchaeota archaeon]|jgi:hypothetical protein